MNRMNYVTLKQIFGSHANGTPNRDKLKTALGLELHVGQKD